MVEENSAQNAHFDIGTRGLLVFMGQRYMVSILNSDDKAVRVSFPVSDFPIEGMGVTLEFHDESGYAAYETEVLESAQVAGNGLLLKRPEEGMRTHHRSSWRIPADFKIQLKDHVHPRWHEVPVINLSAGGLLVRTVAVLEPGDNVDLQIALPGDGARHEAVGQVVHTAHAENSRDHAHLAGVKFVGLDPEAMRALSRYIWRRLRELHAGEMGFMRRASDQPHAQPT